MTGEWLTKDPMLNMTKKQLAQRVQHLENAAVTGNITAQPAMRYGDGAAYRAQQNGLKQGRGGPYSRPPWGGSAAAPVGSGGPGATNLQQQKQRQQQQQQ